jgi:hypothetical protein
MAGIIGRGGKGAEATRETGGGRQRAQGDDPGGIPEALLEYLRQQHLPAVIGVLVAEYAELVGQPPAERRQVGGQGLGYGRIGVLEDPGTGGEAPQAGGPGPPPMPGVDEVGAGSIQRDEKHVLDPGLFGAGRQQEQQGDERQHVQSECHGKTIIAQNAAQR